VVLTTGQEVGTQFITALRAADFAAIGNCLSPAVRLRALLPGRTVDAEGREAAVALLSDWLEAGSGCTVIDASADIVGRRLHLAYRVRLDGAGGPRVMEQQAYCDVTADAISSVRLLCSGGMPLLAG
jgi:hypothetical protein